MRGVGFTGEVGRKRVDLRGKSSREATRDEVLEKTRLERERRRQNKLEQQSATVIQAYWRRWRDCRHAQAALWAEWAQRYGEQGERISRSDLRLDQPCLSTLVVLLENTDVSAHRRAAAAVPLHLQRLAAACKALLEVSTQPGGLSALLPPSSSGGSNGSTGASNAAVLPLPPSRAVWLLSRLAALCVPSLGELAPQADTRRLLAAPRPAHPAAAAAPLAAPLVELLLLLASPDAWGWLGAGAADAGRAGAGRQGSMVDAGGARAGGQGGAWTAAGAAAAVVTRLLLGQRTPEALPSSPAAVAADSGALGLQPGPTAGRPTGAAPGGWRGRGGATLWRTLARLLLLSQPAGGAAHGAGGAGRSYAEVLTTQLVVRALAVKAPGGGGQLVLDGQPPWEGLHLLLCVPNLTQSVTSLEPVIKHLVRQSANSLAALPAPWLARHPRAYLLSDLDGQPCGTVGSCLALLGNLVLGGSKALAQGPGPPAAPWALVLCTALSRLLSLLPTGVLRGGPASCSAGQGAGGPDEDEGELVEALAAVLRAGVAAEPGLAAGETEPGLAAGGDGAAAAAAAAGMAGLVAPLPGWLGMAAVASPQAQPTEQQQQQQQQQLLQQQKQQQAMDWEPAAPRVVGAAPGQGQSWTGRPKGAAGPSQEQAVAAGLLLPPRLALHAGQVVPPDLLASAQALLEVPGRQLLRELVTLLLPHTGPAPAPPAVAPPPPQAGLPAALQHLPGALQLCHLVQQLGTLVPSRQLLYVMLSLADNFVSRAWFSVLRTLRAHHLQQPPVLVAQPSTGGAAVAAVRQGGRQPLPPLPLGMDVLTVTCQVLTAHLAVAEVGEFHRGQPLPLREIYNPQQPSAGLLSMLKDTLWSLLWNTWAATLPAPSSVSPAAHALATTTSLLATQAQQHSSGPGAVVAAAATAAAAAEQELQQRFWLQRRRAFLASASALYGTLYELNGVGTSSAGSPASSPASAQVDGGGGGTAEAFSVPRRQTQFCPPAAFYASNLGPDRFAAEAAAARASQEGPSTGHLSARTDLGYRIWQVLSHAPALVPFEERARLFQAEVAATRREVMEGEMRAQQEIALLTGQFQPNHFVTIRRKQLLFDGFDKLDALGPAALKGRVRVAFVDDQGAPEAGVDGGGLFKDFMEGLIKEGFGGDNGLFAANAENQLYPNAGAYHVVPEAPRLLNFLGRMLGKAMWEGILLELPLARFFLKKLRGGRCDLRDLPSLDHQLYQNLVTLRSYKGDLSELSLTFTATHEVFGAHQEVELKPGGNYLAVTLDNAGEYIARMADFRLNVEPSRACAAFISGFHDLVRPEWVALFNEAELQMLISGRSDGEGGGIDVPDLRAHAHYAGGYHEEHPVVALLWEAVAGFTPEQQHAFLRFVTACSRAPLLGFRYLEPQLCVQMAGSVLDPESTRRLPTAATCLNMLKLPPYPTLDMMRAKLLTAITGATTFELS